MENITKEQVLAKIEELKKYVAEVDDKKEEIKWEDSKDELYTYFGKCPCGNTCVIVGSKYCSECGAIIKNRLRSTKGE